MNKSGKIVKTKKGRIGVVYDNAESINNKIVVHLDDNLQILCDPKTLTLIGYVD